MSNKPKLNKKKTLIEKNSKKVRNPLLDWPMKEHCFCGSGIQFQVCCMKKLTFLVPDDKRAKDLRKKILDRFPGIS